MEKTNNMKKPKLLFTIRKWLALIILGTLAAGLFFSMFFLTARAKREAGSLLRQSVEDVRQDVEDMMVDTLAMSAFEMASVIGSIDELEQYDEPNAHLEALLRYNDFTEINVVDSNGMIVYSTVPEYIGYDMSSGEQSAEFLQLLEDDRAFYVQDARRISYDDTTVMRYAATPFADGSGFVQIGISDTYFRFLMEINLPAQVRNKHIGKSGYMLIAFDSRYVLGSPRDKVLDEYLDPAIPLNGDSSEILYCKLKDGDYYVYIQKVEEAFVIGLYPVSEAEAAANISVMVVLIINIAVFIILFLVLSGIMKKKVVNGIVSLNGTLTTITKGNLDVKADVRTSEEFSSLSDGINETVDALKELIAKEAERIDKELALAQHIQQSALPSVFPPYPDRTDFNLHAKMFTAKEVGGDFYDFYFLDENKLAFMVADVSGKGIPAAMFMMTGKTTIRGFAESGNDLYTVFYNANNRLCEGNEADMFITAWMGVLETDTGLVRFVDAGHNPPLVIRDGSAFYITQKPNLLLASLEDIPYREQTLQLEKGDVLFLYTDGVTEATDADGQLYGEERLAGILSGIPEDKRDDCDYICDAVKKDIDEFVGDAPQFDDITMLCLY